MGFWDRLSRRGQGKAKASPSASGRVDRGKDRRIKALLRRAEKIKWPNADNQQLASICTELLALLDEDSPYVLYALRQRAVALNLLGDYDAAIQDIQRELEIRQQGRSTGSMVNELYLSECQDFLQETLDRKRRAEVEASGSETARKLKAMEQQSRGLGGPDADAAFDSLLADLQNGDPDVRSEASRLLADHPSAVKRLISIYRECLDSDPRRASLAGRVLGRKVAGASSEIVSAQSTQRWYGLAASFITSTCVHCGALNRGIPAPPSAPWVPYYHRANGDGAYVVPVLCDQCGKEFFVAWETDPR